MFVLILQNIFIMKKITLVLLLLTGIFQAQTLREVYHSVQNGTPSGSVNEPGTILYPVGYNMYSSKTPVIFVHGITGKLTGGYEAHIQGVMQYGIKAAFVQLYPTGSPEENGMLLKRMIDRVAQHYGSATVSIVAHSKGGLDTERALYGHNPYNYSIPSFGYEKVDGVYTFGSPLKGSRVADVGSALSWTGIAWIAMWYLNAFDLTQASVQEFHNWAKSWRINSNGSFRNYYNPNGVSYSRLNMVEDNTTRWWAHQSDDPCYENKWYFCYVGNAFHHTVGAYLDAYWEWDWFNSGWRNWHPENDGFIAVYRARREVVQNASPAFTPGAGDSNYITMNDANHTSLWDPGQGHFVSEVAPYLHYGLYAAYRPGQSTPEKDQNLHVQQTPEYPVYLSNGTIIESLNGQANLIIEDDNASYEVSVLSTRPLDEITLSKDNRKIKLSKEFESYRDEFTGAYMTHFSVDNLEKGVWNVSTSQKELVFIVNNLTPTTAFGVKWNINKEYGYEGKPVEIKISNNQDLDIQKTFVMGVLTEIGNQNGIILPEKQKMKILVARYQNSDDKAHLYQISLEDLNPESRYALRIIARTTEGKSLLDRNVITTFYVPEDIPVREITVSNKQQLDNLENGSIKIFPNPATRTAYISLPFKGQKTISVYDVSGKQIEQILTHEGFVELDVSDYTKGLYLIKVKFENGTEKLKLIVK